MDGIIWRMCVHPIVDECPLTVIIPLLYDSIGWQLRVLPTAEFLNIRKKYEIKAHLRGRSFLSVPGRVKRTSVPG